MGRLQQKKTPDAKKKSRDKTEKRTTVVANIGSVAVKESRPKTISLPKKAPGQTRSAAGVQKQNFLRKSIQFLREVRMELKKVTWPSRKQTIGSTIVTIVLVMIISLFLGVVDMSLSSLIQIVLQ